MVDRTENILVEFDYNNITIVDPNKVVDLDGKVKERYVNQEDLVMYANLECKMIPRTKLAVGVASNDTIQTVSLASINFLNQGGKEFLDNSYTDELTGKDSVVGNGVNQIYQKNIPTTKKSEDYFVRQTLMSNGKIGAIDNGLLGINSITINQDTSFLPTIDMQLTDVKGRAMFEAGDNSPYAAFFNLPYPLFYLTIKGYYGKAVKLALMLQTFSTRYDTSDGNFKITLKFYTYKYTILNELSMGYLIATPHMYQSRIRIKTTEGGPSSTVSTDDKIVERGYQKIKEMYSEYKSKGLIADDFPELTIVQLRNNIENFIKNTLDSFTKQNLDPITDVESYQKTLNDYEKDVFLYLSQGKGSWFDKYIDKVNFFVIRNTKQKVYTYKAEIKTTQDKEKAKKELISLITEYNKKLENNPTFGKNKSYTVNGIIKKVSIPNLINEKTFNYDLNSTEIDLDETYKQRKKSNVQPNQADKQNLINELVAAGLFSTVNITEIGGFKLTKTDYFIFEDSKNSFMDLTNGMSKKLKVYREQIESDLSNALSDLLQSKNNGIGFVPTIRNVLAVIFASGEAFLRLLDEVHTNAWDVREDKYRKEAILTKETSTASQDNLDSGDNSNLPIYPWPQFLVATPGENGREKFEIEYPGDSKYISKTKGYLYDVWPEIEFVEEFIKGFVQRTIPPSEPTAGNNSQTETNRISLNAIEFPISNQVFANKEESKFFYEIYERLLLYHFYSRLIRTKTSNETDGMVDIIAEAEANNILKSLSNDNPFLIKTLKDYGFNSANFVNVLRHISNDGIGESWQNFERGIFNTSYIKNLTNNSSTEILSEEDYLKSISSPLTSLNKEDFIVNYLNNSTTSNTFDYFDIYPFTNDTWDNSYLANSASFTKAENAFNTTKTLNFSQANKIIQSFKDTDGNNTRKPFTNFGFLGTIETPPITEATNETVLQSFYNTRNDNYKKQLLTEGNVTYLDYSGGVEYNQTTSMLNTPYFINSIQVGVDNFRNFDTYPYKAGAYLFLNSLPLATLKEKYKTNDNGEIDLDYIFASLKKFGAIHKLPKPWVLKLGGIWHRYKTYIETGVDFLDTSFSGFNYTYNFDPVTNDPTKDYSLDIGDSTNVDFILEKNTTFGSDLATLLNVGFYPKLIDDFNVFQRGKLIFSSYTSADIQVPITNDELEIMYIPSAIIDHNVNTPILNRNIRVIPWTVFTKTSDGNFFLQPSSASLINQTEFECIVNNELTTEISGNKAVFNGSVRLFWAAPNFGYFDVDKIVKTNPTQHLKEILTGSSTQQNFSLLGNSSYYSSIDEIFGVFEKSVLDIFEEHFLDYSKSIYDTLNGDSNSNFQAMIRDITIVPKLTGQTTTELLKNIQSKQMEILNTKVKNFMTQNVYLKFGNPSNYNKKLFYTFSSLEITDPYTWNYYNTTTPNALPDGINGVTLATSKSNYSAAWKSLETYVGFSNIPELKYKDSGSYIFDFFIDNNIAFEPINIENLTPIIKIYVTQKLKNNTLNQFKFIEEMTTTILDVDSFQNKVIDNLMLRVRKELPVVDNTPMKSIMSELQGDLSKREYWEAFKSINDKWISGTDFKTKTLFEDVLLLDRASRNVGDIILVDIYKLKARLQGVIDSPKQTMLVFIQTILQENNFVVMNLPSYVNFYNVQDAVKNPKPKSEGTLEFANTLFGTFLNVDYRQSGPKLVCFYAGKPSEHLAMNENVDYRYRNDTFDLRKNDNPLVENQIGKTDWDKSNKVVGFNVDIGPQNQSIFYGFMVDQKNSSSTFESLEVTNQMGNVYGGVKSSSQSISLYNLYKNRSYTCTISMMGNALIQPTMYFNLRHVPMFTGPYMITSVNHNINPGSFETIITGVRQPTASLPKIDNYIQSLKTNLLQNILENSKQERAAKEKETKDASGNTISQKNKAVSNANGGKTLTDPQVCKPNSPYELYYNITPTVTNTTFSVAKSVILDAINISGFGDDGKLKYVIFATLYIESANGDIKLTAYENNYAGITLTNSWGAAGNQYFGGNQQFFCLETSDGKFVAPYAVFDDLLNCVSLLVSRWKSRMVILPNVDASTITDFWVNNFSSKTTSVTLSATDKSNIQAKVQKAIDIFNASN